MTRAEAAVVVEAIHGARVEHVELFEGVLVLELFHKGTDDDAYRIAFIAGSAVADAWPWPEPAGRAAGSS